jgi:hypothetical protein
LSFLSASLPAHEIDFLLQRPPDNLGQGCVFAFRQFTCLGNHFGGNADPSVREAVLFSSRGFVEQQKGQFVETKNTVLAADWHPLDLATPNEGCCAVLVSNGAQFLIFLVNFYESQ